MKINEYRNGIFGAPTGEAKTETPDGITFVNQGNETNNNLVSAHFVTTDGRAFGSRYNSILGSDDEGTRISALDCD